MRESELRTIINQAAKDKLTRFSLIDGHLTTLPAEIGQLCKLTKLDLYGNQLTTLPAEIGQLSNLTTLFLYGNQLEILPIEIGQLSNLTILDLYGNQLTTLPAEIGQLSNLTTLFLSNNQLATLPAEIGQLSSLTGLHLSNNHLTTLPAEIGQLYSLTTLNLSNNHLTTLPVEIGQLSSLTTLNLSNNQLATLPVEIGQLSSLKELDLSGNPIKTPPVEIVEKGVVSIIDYFRQLIDEEKDYIYEAKLLIIGEAGAGKTTLAKKIEDQSYQLKNEISTKGIDVIQWKFPVGDDRDFRVNIWDFGGQEIYHTTHQFFLTKRSLYVLVADSRKEDTDFDYWCNIVELLGGNSPLLVVKNEKDDRRWEINERQLRGQFTNLKETLATNLATDRGLSDILENVKHYTKALPHIGNELPKTWIKVRKILEENRHQHYISLKDYLKICEDNGFKQRKDKLQLIGYLHDLGVCLHFQEDPVLKHTVIINPEWCTNAVYKVLDNDNVIGNLGHFTKSDLKDIWNEDKYSYMHDELLQLMIKFKLCYKIPGTDACYDC
ncbi:MAG: COR domain-containing protein [Desulfobacterales bacterium]